MYRCLFQLHIAHARRFAVHLRHQEEAVFILHNQAEIFRPERAFFQIRKNIRAVHGMDMLFLPDSVAQNPKIIPAAFSDGYLLFAVHDLFFRHQRRLSYFTDNFPVNPSIEEKSHA